MFGVILNESAHQFWIITCTTSTTTYDQNAPMLDQVIQRFQEQWSVEAAPMDKIVLVIIFVAVAALLCAAVVLGFQRKKGVTDRCYRGQGMRGRQDQGYAAMRPPQDAHLPRRRS